MWVAGLPVPVAPSPKVQEKVYGAVPPEAVPVKVTTCPGTGEEGAKLMPTFSADWWTLQPVRGWSSQPEKE